MKRRSKIKKKPSRNNCQHQVTPSEFKTFYSHRPWSDIWLDKFNFKQLEFWARIDDLSSMNLIVQLEKARFLRRVDENSARPRFLPEPSYYNDLKFFLIASKPPALYTVKPHPRIFHHANFIKSCHRAWTSMRILRIFSASQILICSEISKLAAQEFIYQMHKIKFLRLLTRHNVEIFGSEDIYQLIHNTGPLAPLICADGVVYDINTSSIFITDY